MSSGPVSIVGPDGRAHPAPAPPADPAPTLAAWLEAAGWPLNTRCGGRGLCRGCQVHIAALSAEPLQACQLRCGDLPKGALVIRIPRGSRHDASLHGVSHFDLRLQDAGPRRDSSGLGLALDIGTTTVAGALWDLGTGTCLAAAARANAQARFGDNVLARISAAGERPNGPADLQAALVTGSLLPLLRQLAGHAGVAVDAVTCATATGNPIMLHTLAGEPLAGFGRYPFRPVFLDARTLAAADLGFRHAFPIELAAGIGPFVGADIAAGALATGVLDMEPPVLLIDFGTNGEILLRHKGGYLATATAAGPAFEGGRLSCGAVARRGVIAALALADGRWNWTMCGGGDDPPAGISGAAYIDFLAAGHAAGLLNGYGRWQPRHPLVERIPAGAAAGWHVPLTPTVGVTEQDVAELLQAKAAMAAGTATLLELAGIAAADLAAVFVAGGFGYHLNPAHARAIGLLPDTPPECISAVGNSSLGGASLLLLHPGLHTRLESMRAACTVIELNQVPSFEDHFTDALAIG
jgi:uncharacterized 2Fe-2S/4Fe-4S cluster protein (DUF4445 family)